MKGWSRCSAWSDTRPADDRPKRRTLDPDAALAGTIGADAADGED